MAGDWIKMRSNLRRHPKVVRIASALNADRLRVVGGLHAVWCLFDEHSEDGQLSGYTPSAVDEEIGWPGFTQALIGVGWVDWDGNDGLSLPEFDTHNGASAKRRAQEADRKRAERGAAKEQAQEVCKSSASDADKKRTREEKRREESSSLRSEEKQRASRPPSLGEDFLVAQGVPSQAAKDWLKVRKSHRAPLTESAWEGIVSEASKAGITPAEAVQVCARKGWRGFNHAWDWQSAGVVGGAISTAKARNRQEERRNTMAALGGEFVTGASHATGDYIDA